MNKIDKTRQFNYNIVGRRQYMTEREKAIQRKKEIQQKNRESNRIPEFILFILAISFFFG